MLAILHYSAKALSSVNPFNFLQIYRSPKSTQTLKQLTTITTLQTALEGKCMSDMHQIWARNHLMLNFTTGRVFLQCYGLSCVLGGMFLTPLLLKTLSARSFTTLCNVGLMIGKSMRMSSFPPLYFAFTIPVLPGVNGAAASALKGIQGQHAVAAGFGKGEFSAWTNNLRALMSAITPVMMGNLYAYL